MGGYVPFNLQLQKKLDTMFHPKMISGGGKFNGGSLEKYQYESPFHCGDVLYKSRFLFNEAVI